MPPEKITHSPGNAPPATAGGEHHDDAAGAHGRGTAPGSKDDQWNVIENIVCTVTRTWKEGGARFARIENDDHTLYYDMNTTLVRPKVELDDRFALMVVRQKKP